MKAIVFACVVAAFCVTLSLQKTPHEPCADGPIPKELRVRGCDSSPCNIYKGTDMIADWDFVANSDAQKLKPRVKVTIMGFTVNYPYPQQNACESLTRGKCPLKKGDEATYNLKMPISKNYPTEKLKIEFALIDESKNVHVCFKIDASVVDKTLSSIQEDFVVSYM